jgi:hypothetical protein
MSEAGYSGGEPLPADPRSDRSTRALWAILGLLFAALVGVALYKAWPLLHPKVAVSAPLDPGCDLRAGPCTARFPGGGEVRFGIEPRTLPPVAPLRLTADLGGLEAGLVEVDFAGADMNMGYNRVTLERTATGRFEGQGMLPVCVRNRMTWEAKVMLHTANGIWVAPFRFDTVSPGTAG